MLNIFPTMFLSLFAHLLLRLALGGIFIYLGYRHLFRDRASFQVVLHKYRPRSARLGMYALGILEALAGCFLFLGTFTQLAAFAASKGGR